MQKLTHKYDAIYVVTLLLLVGLFVAIEIWDNLKWLWISCIAVVSAVLVWSLCMSGKQAYANGRAMSNVEDWQLKLTLWIVPILVVPLIAAMITGSMWNRIGFICNLGLFLYYFAHALAETCRRKKIRRHLSEKLEE